MKKVDGQINKQMEGQVDNIWMDQKIDKSINRRSDKLMDYWTNRHISYR